MAFSIATNGRPDDWISGYTSSGTSISVPIATFPVLNATKASTSTGDIRELLLALCEGVADSWYTAAAAGDSPAQMIISRSTTVSPSTGASTKTFTFRFVTYSPVGYEYMSGE